MQDKISSIVLYVLFGITIVVAGLFYLGGDVDPNAEYVEPVFTQALMILMYAYVVLAAVLVVVTQGVQFIKRCIADAGQALKSVVGILILALLLVVTYICGSTEQMTVLDVEPLSDTWMKLLDMQLYSIYILVAVGFLLIIAGSFAKKIK